MHQEITFETGQTIVIMNNGPKISIEVLGSKIRDITLKFPDVGIPGVIGPGIRFSLHDLVKTELESLNPKK